ncbi:MAG: hypothetical protein Q7J76_05270, partial [Candidatus Brocadiaceae bacterium]|nr:hypothetical protein [Candidatus Brocadiaceae bacterium]
MYKPTDDNLANNYNEIIEILTTQLQYHQELLRYTCKIKETLIENCNTDLLDKTMNERGLLIDKLISSKKYYDSIKESSRFADNSTWKASVDVLLHQIHELLNSTIIHDAENTCLIRDHIKDITDNLEKI